MSQGARGGGRWGLVAGGGTRRWGLGAGGGGDEARRVGGSELVPKPWYGAGT